MSGRLRFATVAFLLVSGCQLDGTPAAPSAPAATASEQAAMTATEAVQPVDAGDAAFVQRLIPLMWGRKALSSQEVAVLTAAVERDGREAVVRAMARAPAYVDWWELTVRDLLLVSRLGFASNANCYGTRTQPEDLPDLAAFVRDNGPVDTTYGAEFTMRDLVRSSLVLDDLSPVFEAHLVAHLTRALDDTDLLAAMSQRQNRAEAFEIAYLGRRTACLTCHNGEFAVTDTNDAATDRHWPLYGSLEKALFGRSTGLDQVEQMSAFFRRKFVLDGYAYTHDDIPEQDKVDALPTWRPWGWAKKCGDFVRPDAVLEDPATDTAGVPLTSYFIEDYARHGTIWPLESHLRAGLADVRGNPNALGDSSGPRAFATLLAMNLADRLWATAMGSRLTVATGFPRNPFQQAILQRITEALVSGGFSLTDALVSIATHPYFNGAMPADGPHYRAVFDPFVADQLPREERRNSVGHTLRRMPARMMLRGTAQAMGWPEPPEFLLYYQSPDAQLQRGVGTFLKPGDPGFSGISFQSALAWEEHLGLCADLSQASSCPLIPILDDLLASYDPNQTMAATTCEICRSSKNACDWDARCCDVDFALYCPSSCSTGDPKVINFATWPKLDRPDGPDWLEQLLQSGTLTYREVVVALKDRLLASPLIHDDEVAALEGLLDQSLDAPATDPDASARVRRVCGALLQTPQYLLLGDAGATAEELAAPLPTPAVHDYCQTLAPLFEPPLSCPPG